MKKPRKLRKVIINGFEIFASKEDGKYMIHLIKDPNDHKQPSMEDMAKIVSYVSKLEKFCDKLNANIL